MKKFLEERAGEILVIIAILGLFISNLGLRNQLKDLEVKTKKMASVGQPLSQELLLEEKLRKFPYIVKALGEENIKLFVGKTVELTEKYKNQGLTTSLLLGLIKVESGFNPQVVSKAKNGVTPVAYGLMQVTRGTGTSFLANRQIKWTFDTATSIPLNLDVGTEFLMLLHSNFVQLGIEDEKEFSVSLVAYYMGERPVLSSLDSNKRTTISLEYLGKVKRAAQEFENYGI